MITSKIDLAAAEINKAMAEHHPERFYALFSGGHDSLTATALAARHTAFDGVIHINTGIGIEETREFVRATCVRQGWPLHELYAPDGEYERLVFERGGFPYGEQSHNAMLFYLKQRPLRKFLRDQPGRHLLVTGIRREESTRRFGAGIATTVRRDHRQVWVSPLLDWTASDCGALLAHDRLERNQVVDVLHRSGECLCGAFAQQREIHELALWFPDAAARIQSLERECEARGIVACVWAGRSARSLHEDQTRLFPLSDYAPLCSSCEAHAIQGVE